MQKMRALIASSGRQLNGFFISEPAIRQMSKQHNEGKPLLNQQGQVCGYLNQTELIRDQETGALELWGYFTYTSEEADFSENRFCSYEISYKHEDMDKDKVLHAAALSSCVMVDDLER